MRSLPLLLALCVALCHTALSVGVHDRRSAERRTVLQADAGQNAAGLAAAEYSRRAAFASPLPDDIDMSMLPAAGELLLPPAVLLDLQSELRTSFDDQSFDVNSFQMPALALPATIVAQTDSVPCAGEAPVETPVHAIILTDDCTPGTPCPATSLDAAEQKAVEDERRAEAERDARRQKAECLAADIASKQRELNHVSSMAGSIRSKFVDLQKARQLIRAQLLASKHALDSLNEEDRVELSRLKVAEAESDKELQKEVLKDEQRAKKDKMLEYQSIQSEQETKHDIQLKMEEAAKQDVKEATEKQREEERKHEKKATEEMLKLKLQLQHTQLQEQHDKKEIRKRMAEDSAKLISRRNLHGLESLRQATLATPPLPNPPPLPPPQGPVVPMPKPLVDAFLRSGVPLPTLPPSPMPTVPPSQPMYTANFSLNEPPIGAPPSPDGPSSASAAGSSSGSSSLGSAGSASASLPSSGSGSGSSSGSSQREFHGGSQSHTGKEISADELSGSSGEPHKEPEDRRPTKAPIPFPRIDDPITPKFVPSSVRMPNHRIQMVDDRFGGAIGGGSDDIGGGSHGGSGGGSGGSSGGFASHTAIKGVHGSVSHRSEQDSTDIFPLHRPDPDHTVVQIVDRLEAPGGGQIVGPVSGGESGGVEPDTAGSEGSGGSGSGSGSGGSDGSDMSGSGGGGSGGGGRGGGGAKGGRGGGSRGGDGGGSDDDAQQIVINVGEHGSISLDGPGGSKQLSSGSRHGSGGKSGRSLSIGSGEQSISISLQTDENSGSESAESSES